MLSIGTPAGGLVGSVIVLGLLPYTTWRGTFVACGLATLMLGVAVLLFVRESPSFELTKGRRGEAQRLVRRHLGEEFDPEVSRHPSTEAGQSESFLTRRNLRLNIGAGLGFFVLAVVSYALIIWTSILLTASGFGVEQALKAVLAFNMAAVTAAVAGGFLMARFGSRIVMITGSLLLMLALGGLAVVLSGVEAPPTAVQVWATYVLIAGAGGFAGVGMASVYSIMAVGYPVNCRAGGLGFGMMLGRAGGILASFAGGYMIELDALGGFAFFGVLVACAAIGAVCAIISDRHVEPTTAARPSRSVVAGSSVLD